MLSENPSTFLNLTTCIAYATHLFVGEAYLTSSFGLCIWSVESRILFQEVY